MTSSAAAAPSHSRSQPEPPLRPLIHVVGEAQKPSSLSLRSDLQPLRLMAVHTRLKTSHDSLDAAALLRPSRTQACRCARSAATCPMESGPCLSKALSRCPARRSHIGCPRLVVWLSHGLRGPGIAEQGEAQEGSARLEVALPSLLDVPSGSCGEALMTGVVIGMDPHRRSVTIEVMAPDEAVLDGGRYATDGPGYAAMLRHAQRWPGRVWAIEGCNGIGRHVAVRLLANGEQVVDVPPKLSARVRVYSTGQGRKTDATDAHSIALVGTRMAGLRPVVDDQQLAVLRIRADWRRALGEDHTRMVAQLHLLLVELIPGRAKKDLSAAQARALLAKVRPRDAAGKARGRVAAELGRPRTGLRAQEGRRQRAPRAHRGDRDVASDVERHRPIRRNRAADRRRRHHPVPHQRVTSRRGTAPPRSTRPPATRSATGSRGRVIARSTGRCTSWRPSNCATRLRAGPTTTARRPPARPQ